MENRTIDKLSRSRFAKSITTRYRLVESARKKKGPAGVCLVDLEQISPEDEVAAAITERPSTVPSAEPNMLSSPAPKADSKTYNDMLQEYFAANAREQGSMEEEEEEDDEYEYDYYVSTKEALPDSIEDICAADISSQLETYMIRHEELLFDEQDDEGSDSEDSNRENHPDHDYPDEEDFSDPDARDMYVGIGGYDLSDEEDYGGYDPYGDMAYDDEVVEY